MSFSRFPRRIFPTLLPKLISIIFIRPKGAFFVKDCYDVAIIGGGPGGCSAALYCARAGCSVLLLEKLAPGGQLAATDQVENYPGFDRGISGFDLAKRMWDGAQRFGAELLSAPVEAADLSACPKRLQIPGDTILARTVILATGALPRELGLPGERELRGKGVSYCAACDGAFYRGKTVVVAGGGNSAAADALFLSRLCQTVYLVHRRDRLRASPSYLSSLQSGGVQFLWNSRVTALHCDQVLTGVTVQRVDSGETTRLDCAGLFVAIGRVPDTTLFRGQLSLDGDGYLMANETTRTSLPGVFAVGDVRTKPLRQVVTAAADGAVASHFVEEYLSLSVPR